MKAIITIVMTMTGLLLLSAQVTNEGSPASWQQTEEVKPEAIYIAPPDLVRLAREDAQNAAEAPKPWRFGSESIVDHNLSNSGVWSVRENGDRIWRIRYHSPGAKTLNFLFSDFFMPEGAKVYLYNDARTDLLGAYTSSQNSKENVLGTWLVSGDDVWIEYFEPAAMSGQGRLEVFKVVHGYRTIAFGDDVNNGDDCMYDAECFVSGVNNLKDISKNSVAMLIVNSTGFCSGALINNTSNDGTPYLLTANHCYSDPSEWAMLFKWKSAEPVCGVIKDSQTPVNFRLTSSGASLRARHGVTDFALVELITDIPADWGLVWSGWDRSQTVPPMVYGLHHPRGAAMKVSVDYDSPQMTPGGLDNGLVWTVFGWEVGALQPGSSGSALFDHNGRIRGQAWYIYGNEGCYGIIPGGQSSGYGRLNVAWAEGPTPQTRLREWLDPTQTGALTTDYFPPQTLPPLRADIDFYESTPFFCRTDTTPAIRLINKGSETITAAQISYAYNSVQQATVNWTGVLPVNESVVVVLPPVSGNGDTVIDVSLQGLDNVTLEPAQIVSISTLVEADPVFETDWIGINIQTDAFAEETSWDIYNEIGIKVDWVPSALYQPLQTYNHTLVLSPGCYTFVIKDDFGDGMCCALGIGSYSLTDQEGSIIRAGGSFGAREISRFRISSPLSTNEVLKAEVKIYPNPTEGVFMINSSGTGTVSSYTCYSVTGQVVASGSIQSTVTEVDLRGLSRGVYIVKVNSVGAESNHRLVIN